MNLVAETPHLSKIGVLVGHDVDERISPEVEEDEDRNQEGDDGHSVPKEENEDLPLFHPTSWQV